MEPTETPTPPPTETLTPTATYTPTPNYYWEGTAEPSGVPVRVVREISASDYTIALLLFAILVSLWVMWLVTRLTSQKGGR